MSGLTDLVDRINAEKAAKKEVITRVVMGPFIPASHPDQRYFTRKDACSSDGNCLGVHDHIRVYRDKETDFVEVGISCVTYDATFKRSSSATLNVGMSAPQLRALAARLLDAAHDLETYPSAVLMAGDQRMGAMVESES